MIRIYQTIAGGLTLSILLFSLGQLHGKSCTKEYVYVDMDRIVQAIGTSLDSGNLQQDELSIQVDYYQKKFQKLLDDYSTSQNMIIFAKPKVISGASDKTDFFIEKLLGGEA